MSASIALQRFQDSFARSLLMSDAVASDCADQCDAEWAALVSQPGFAVYRNTVMKGCIDALQANYPAVTALVGEHRFRAAAALFVRTHVTSNPILIEYGEQFAVFLETFAPAADLPGIADLARLDRWWTEAHIARDEEPVPAAAVAQLDAAQLALVVLQPHTSARWRCFDGQPVAATWRRLRKLDDATDEPDSSGVLIVRPYGAVHAIGIDAAGCAFLDACTQGHTLAGAAHAALAADPHTDLSQVMATLLNAGAFGGLTLVDAVTKEKTQ